MRHEMFKEIYFLSGPVCLLVFTLFLTYSCTSRLHADTEDVIDRSFNVSAGGTLTIDVSRASIEVETGSSDVVKVKVIRRVGTSSENRAQRIFDRYKVEFHHSGSNVSIETDDDTRQDGLFSWLRGTNFRVRFLVTVPSKYNLDLKTSGGSIRVNDIQGDVKAKTSGGSLKFEMVKGQVKGKTSGGSIRLEGCTGSADLYTSGGSIRIGTVEGDVKAITSGGSINVDEVMGTIKGETSGGSITAAISKQPKGDCRLTTSGGSITVRMAEDTAVDLEAKTSGGTVSADFRMSMSGEISKHYLKGKINGGGPELYLKTSGGSIRIKKM